MRLIPGYGQSINNNSKKVKVMKLNKKIALFFVTCVLATTAHPSKLAALYTPNARIVTAAILAAGGAGGAALLNNKIREIKRERALLNNKADAPEIKEKNAEIAKLKKQALFLILGALAGTAAAGGLAYHHHLKPYLELYNLEQRRLNPQPASRALPAHAPTADQKVLKENSYLALKIPNTNGDALQKQFNTMVDRQIRLLFLQTKPPLDQLKLLLDQEFGSDIKKTKLFKAARPYSQDIMSGFNQDQTNFIRDYYGQVIKLINAFKSESTDTPSDHVTANPIAPDDDGGL